MPDNIQNGWGAQALDLNQQQNRYQNAIISGCAASDGATAMDIDIASGEAIVAGSKVSVAASTVTLSASNTDPRKDVIYIDSSGAVQVADGTPAVAKPADETGRDTYQPRPPDLSATDAAVVAEVWVGGGVSDVGSADLSDRRLFADIRAGDAVTESLTTEDATITNSFLIDGATIGSPTDATVLQTHVSDNYTTVEGLAETTVTADNTATTIWGTDPPSGPQREGMHLVWGVNTADVNQTFTELVLQTGGGETAVVSSVTRSSPGARSYSVNLGALRLAIDGGGTDYTVVTQTLGGRIA